MAVSIEKNRYLKIVRNDHLFPFMRNRNEIRTINR